MRRVHPTINRIVVVAVVAMFRRIFSILIAQERIINSSIVGQNKDGKIACNCATTTAKAPVALIQPVELVEGKTNKTADGYCKQASVSALKARAHAFSRNHRSFSSEEVEEEETCCLQMLSLSTCLYRNGSDCVRVCVCVSF